MTLASEVKKLMESALAVELTVDNLVDSFYGVLSQFGYENFEVDAVIFDTAYAIRIIDEEGDDVIIFCECDDGESLIYVIADEDIVIDITPIDPDTTDDDHCYIDPTFSWINKSVLDAILQAGGVNESEMYVLKGGSKIKLPVVYVNDEEYEEAIAGIVDELNLVKPDWFIDEGQ